MKRIILALLLAIALSAAPAHAADRSTIRLGSSGHDVIVAQFILKAQGFVLPVDGKFGARTDKVVKAFQRFNGLEVDGIVGPATWEALESAVRMTLPTPPPPSPPALTGCAEMEFLRAEVGLPSAMDAIGWRESNCRNDVTSRTGCCVGYFQIHTGNFTAPGYRAGIAACGVDERSDILGNSIEQKRANACVAKVLYDVSGMSPWRL